MEIYSLLKFPAGSVAVIDEDGRVYGPYQNDVDAQFILEQLHRSGLEAVAIECIGNN